MGLVLAIVARARLLRGRCPSCNSEGAGVQSCETCLGYAGPFPASQEAQTRWIARYARSHAHSAPQGAARPIANLSLVR